ncbi:radical SAM protein [Streptomyces sp. MNU76]|uniref:radical SAM protein n=1 Tax=Streptomyces sp. MNU76 TaxID=2560026 RepID=UPI0035A9197E
MTVETVMGRPLLPLRQFVLKMHSRCDLACDHCYVYEHADQSWSRRPVVVSDGVPRATAERIAEHAGAHGLPAVHVVLHGGEPLLAGRARLRRAATELTAALSGVREPDLRIHTNAVTLDGRFLDLCDEFGIKVGVSLDGDRAANDLHRRYADGRSSHDRVLKGIALLNRPRHRPLFAGLLCTVDLRNDPVAVHDAPATLAPTPRRLPPPARHLGRAAHASGRGHRRHGVRASAAGRPRPVDRDRSRHGRPELRLGAADPARREQPDRVAGAGARRSRRDRDRRDLRTGGLPHDRARRGARHRTGRVPQLPGRGRRASGHRGPSAGPRRGWPSSAGPARWCARAAAVSTPTGTAPTAAASATRPCTAPIRWPSSPTSGTVI